MKRKTSVENGERATKRQKLEQSKPLPISTALQGLTIDDLPLEIIGNQIFKFFQFHYWLKNLVVVCKRWSQAAINSNAQKQLVITDISSRSNVLCLESVATATKYQITEIMVYNKRLAPSTIALLLQASKKVTAFALCNALFEGFQSSQRLQNITFPSITTVAIPSSLLKHFPNAERVELYDKDVISDKDLISDALPKVMEVNLAARSTNAYISTLKCLPNVKKCYISYPEVSVKQLQHEFPKVTFIVVPEHCRVYNSPTRPLVAAIRACIPFDQLFNETSWEHEVDLRSRTVEYSFPSFHIDYSESSLMTEAEMFREIEFNDVIQMLKEYTAPQLVQLIPTKHLLFLMARGNAFYDIESDDNSRNLEQFLLDNMAILQRNVDAKYFLIISLLMLGEERLMQLFSEEAIQTIINKNPDQPSILTYYNKFPGEIRALAPFIEDWSDDTIVHTAARNDYLDDAILFVQNGAKVHIDKLFDQSQTTRPLMSLHYGRVDNSIYNYELLRKDKWTSLIKAIIEQKATSVPIKYWLFESDWLKADRFWLKDVLDLLIELGADVNALQRHPEKFKGGSLFNWLIYNDVDNDILEQLTSKYGINPGQIDDRGHTALSTAIQFAPDKVKYLITSHYNKLDLRNGFVMAMYHGRRAEQHINWIDLFLDYGADINGFGRAIQSNVEQTPLMAALQCSQICNTVIEYMLLLGARTDLISAEGDTVLTLANNVSLTSALIHHGADVNKVIPSNGLSPLMLTAKRSSDHIGYYLLQHGADITLRDKEGQSYVHYLLSMNTDLYDDRLAVLLTTKYKQFFVDEAKSVIQSANSINLYGIYRKFLSFVDLTTLLIEEIGVDVNTQCSVTGQSFVSLAAKLEVVEYLISHGINVNLQDKYGESALMHVIKDKVRCSKREQFIKLLLNNGADVNLKNHKGISPSDIEPQLILPYSMATQFKMKRKKAIENEEYAKKKRKVELSESHIKSEEPLGLTIADLPLEILGNQIFKFFQFHYWLKNLVVVCKRWKRAAIQANAQKQLVVCPRNFRPSYRYDRSTNQDDIDIEPIETASQYQITELFIYEVKITPAAVVLLLQASKKLTLLALCNIKNFKGFGSSRQYKDIKFPNIKTVFVTNDLLHHFPSATHLELLDDSPITQVFPKVTELVLPKQKELSMNQYQAILQHFPLVKKAFMFNDDLELDILQNTFPHVTFITKTQHIPYRFRVPDIVSILYTSVDQLLKESCWEYDIDLHSQIAEYSFPYFKEEWLYREFSKEELNTEIKYNGAEVDVKLAAYLPPQIFLHLLLYKDSYNTVVEDALLTNFNVFKNNAPTLFAVAALRILGTERFTHLFSEKQIRELINDSPNHPSILTYYDEQPIQVRWLAPYINDWSSDTIVDAALNKSFLEHAIYFIQQGARVFIDRLFNRSQTSDGESVYMRFFGEPTEDDFYTQQTRFNVTSWTNIIKSILDKKATSVPIKDWLFESDWYLAYHRCTTELLDLLIELGADINAKQVQPEEFKDGSLFNWLVANDVDEKILDYLTSKYGVNPGQVDDRGHTALSTAIQFTPNKIEYLLQKHGEQLDLQNGLLAAMAIDKPAKDFINIIDSFLDSGADINAFGRSSKSTIDRTPLMEALHYKHSCRVIKYMLLQGARTDLSTSNGNTALTIAIEYGADVDTIDVLVKFGADINHSLASRTTPLMMTAHYNLDRIGVYLLQHGADINQRDMEGRSYVAHLLTGPIDLSNGKLIKILTTTHKQLFIDEAKNAIQLATDKQDSIALFIIFSKFLTSIDLTKLLIEEIGVDVNTQCSVTGQSFVSLAAKLEVVEYLISHGINVNMQDKYGESALMHVIKDKVRCSEREQLIELLLNNGADLNLKNHKGISPSDLEPQLMSIKMIFTIERKC